MMVKDKVAVVTGGANGIGAALCVRIAEEGAKAVVVADIDGDAAASLANRIDGLGIACDVSREEDIVRLVRTTREKFGQLDLFCSNAGIIVKGGVEVANSDWQRLWEINVMAHVYASRAVIPAMLEQGGGAFVITASAAGLLNQINSAVYTVTKHAAVGLASNLAINYGDRGIQVMAVCPMAVHSLMTRNGGGIAALDGMIKAEVVADHVVDALGSNKFMVYPHPEVADYVRTRAADPEKWLQGMQGIRKKYLDSKP